MSVSGLIGHRVLVVIDFIVNPPSAVIALTECNNLCILGNTIMNKGLPR